MENLNIYESNILIAKFMGWKEDGTGILKNGKENPFLYLHTEKYPDGFAMPKVDFKYHSDWNRLMEVVAECHKKTSLGIAMHYEINKQYAVVISFIKSLNERGK